MLYYRLMLKNGDGVPIDMLEAARYIKMSADKGFKLAIEKYSDMLNKGDGITINKNEALKYLRVLKKMEKKDENENYIFLIPDMEKTFAEMKERANLYRMGAIQGHIESMCDYATVLYYGEGVDLMHFP